MPDSEVAGSAVFIPEQELTWGEADSHPNVAYAGNRRSGRQVLAVFDATSNETKVLLDLRGSHGDLDLSLVVVEAEVAVVAILDRQIGIGSLAAMDLTTGILRFLTQPLPDHQKHWFYSDYGDPEEPAFSYNSGVLEVSLERWDDSADATTCRRRYRLSEVRQALRRDR